MSYYEMMELEKLLAEAEAQGKTVLLEQYIALGLWTTPKAVSADKARAKARVMTPDGYCPYRFSLA